MWGGWNSVFPEPRAALGRCPRGSAPLLALRRRRLLAGLSLPAGELLPCHADVFQPSDPSDTGAKRDPGLAQEAALAQVLPRLQTAHHGKGRAGDGGKQPAFQWSPPTFSRLGMSALRITQVSGTCWGGFHFLKAGMN